MLTIHGRHNTAVCFTDSIEDSAAAQIKTLCDQDVFTDSRIRIMPDVHTGMGCTIGTTMTITNKVVPGMVGVDIGCGMETVRLAERDIDFDALDNLIRSQIPCGREVRKIHHPLNYEIDLEALRCAPYVGLARGRLSLGTLGGGNHFIEIDRSDNGELYLVVHSGSRHLGLQVCNYYQEQGRFAMWGGARYQLDREIARYREEGRQQEIQPMIDEMKKEHPLHVPKELAYVKGKLFDDYIHDMKIIQQFAVLNRKAMVDVLVTGMGLTPVEEFTTIHNYIDTDAMILRKGAVSAKLGQKLLIPINMRDGSLICIGKGNPDWNYSAPHGAGRIMSRKQAFASLSMEQYRQEMAGIYSSCVSFDTLDESPMAYKDMADIVRNIEPTAEIAERIHPVYNFKAAE